MILHSLYQIVMVFLLSGFKFGFGGVPLAEFVYKFPFFKLITVTTAGGVTGAILFAYISEWVLDTWHKFRMRKFPQHEHHERKHAPESKLVKKIREKWGLYGIAFFTPFILSIPIGTLIAVHFYHDKQKVISYMIVSIVGWVFFFYFFYNYLAHFHWH